MKQKIGILLMLPALAGLMAALGVLIMVLVNNPVYWEVAVLLIVGCFFVGLWLYLDA